MLFSSVCIPTSIQDNINRPFGGDKKVLLLFLKSYGEIVSVIYQKSVMQCSHSSEMFLL